jgi:hypothetical protein
MLRGRAVGAIVATVAALSAACSADPLVQPTGAVSSNAVARETPGFAATNADNASQNQLLSTIRDATDQYHDVAAAVADGYVLGSPCEAMPGQGIGIHYRKGSLIDGVVDPAQPELLVYEPRDNGKLQLVAVAFVVRSAIWDATHNSPPMLGDQVFEDKRVPDWSSPPFPNYELHVWVWKHNSNGMYATTNPSVSCEP